MQLLERTPRRPIRKHDHVAAGRSDKADEQAPHHDVESIVEAGRVVIAENLSDKPADFLEASRQLGAE